MAFFHLGGNMEKEIVSAIQKFIKTKRDEENILNIIVRDDVFAILEQASRYSTFEK